MINIHDHMLFTTHKIHCFFYHNMHQVTLIKSDKRKIINHNIYFVPKLLDMKSWQYGILIQTKKN